MIFQPAIILLAASLSTQSLKWMKKLNSDIFQLEAEEERGGKTIEEEEGCRPGFFCMFFEDDGLERKKDKEKSVDKRKKVAMARVEDNTTEQQIIIFIFLLCFQMIMLVLYSTTLKQGRAFDENDSISSFEDFTNFSPTEKSTSTSEADVFKHKDEEASKLLNLINIIRDANAKEREGRKGKNINLFDLLPETENTVEGEDDKDEKLPDHMERFFLPADRIIPRQYKRRGNHEHGGKEDPYAPIYDFGDSDDSEGEDGTSDYDDDVDCYTHTIILDGQCWVLCDKALLWPCNSNISDNL